MQAAQPWYEIQNAICSYIFSEGLQPLITSTTVTCSEWNAPGLPRATQPSHDPSMPLIHGFSINVSREKDTA